jgi:PIN domain nuclease of toxin-antitoxin system
VLDASALLALLNAEAGSMAVAESLPSAAISAVNLCEVVGKLAERGMPETQIRTALDGLGLEVHAFEEKSAYEAGMLRKATRAFGLSLGDRACIALGSRLSAQVLTTDRRWQNLKVGAKVRVVR